MNNERIKDEDDKDIDKTSNKNKCNADDACVEKLMDRKLFLAALQLLHTTTSAMFQMIRNHFRSEIHTFSKQTKF